MSRFDSDPEIIREYHKILERQRAFEDRIREIGGIEEWWRRFEANAVLHREKLDKRNNTATDEPV